MRNFEEKQILSKLYLQSNCRAWVSDLSGCQMDCGCVSNFNPEKYTIITPAIIADEGIIFSLDFRNNQKGMVKS